jgi:hypothetical protein
MAVPGISNRNCYTSYPARDKSYTNLAACQAEITHQRALCVAAVDIAADTIRANTIVANEIIVQELVQPPTTAGIFSSAGIAGTISSGALQPFNQASFGFILVSDPNNYGVTLTASQDSAIVDRDGWYQVSLALSQVQVGASDVVWSITVDGLSTTVPVVTSPLNSTGTVRGSIGIRLFAGSVIGLAVTTTAAVLIGPIAASPNALTMVRVGS